MDDTQKSPTVSEEVERLQKWREVRRQAAIAPKSTPQDSPLLDREKRLELFEEDKTRRIRDAAQRRQAEAEALEARRMQKARAHLEALDDIETAKSKLLAARKKVQAIVLTIFTLSVIAPTAATAIWYGAYVETPFVSTSVLALPGATPVVQDNPLFNDVSATTASSMAAAFQLRAQLYDQRDDIAFDIAIDTQQGFLTLATQAAAPIEAAAHARRLITQAKSLNPGLLVLSAPTLPERPESPALKNSLMVFLTCLSAFVIGAIFTQSILHHSRN